MATATTKKVTPADDPKAALTAYLKAKVTADEVGTVEAPAPYITKAGRVYVHSRSMLAWARGEYGKHVTQRDVQAALRSLGLTVRATAMPGLGRSVGFYTAARAPRGVSVKGLPVRELARDGSKPKA